MPVYLTERQRPEPPTDPVRPSVRGRVPRTVVLLGLVSLVTDISSESTSAVLPLYLTAGLGLTPLGYGVVDGLYTAASVPVRWLGGWLADRFDRPKRVALAGYSLSAVARVFLVGGAPPVSVVAGVLGVDRLGKGLRTAPRDLMVAASSPPESLARSFGVHRALDTTGAVLGPLLAFGALWAVPGDYRLVFLLSLAAALVGVALLGLLVPDVRRRRAAGPATTGNLGGVGIAPPRPSLRLLAEPAYARLVGAAGLLGLLTLSDAFLYLVLTDRSDAAATWFPLLFVGTNAVYLSLAVPFGRVADRLGRSRVMVGGHVFLVGAYLCAVGGGGSLLPVVGCLVLLGAFYASTDGVLAASAAGLVAPEVRGSAIATAQSAVALARLAAAVGFGWVWVSVGREAAVVVMAAGLGVAIAAGSVLVGVRGARTTR